MNQYGFVRITCASPRTAVANPAKNADEIVRVLEQAADSDIVLFPELCVTGYTCADLFGQRRSWKPASEPPADRPGDRGPCATGRRRGADPAGNSLFNCAVVIGDGSILGIVPSNTFPTTKNSTRVGGLARPRYPSRTEIELGG